jgi:hypothetical protein
MISRRPLRGEEANVAAHRGDHGIGAGGEEDEVAEHGACVGYSDIERNCIASLSYRHGRPITRGVRSLKAPSK